MGDKKNTLSAKTGLKLFDAFRDEAKQGRLDGKTYPEVAAHMAALLGFTITTANVRNAEEATEVTWRKPREEPRHPQTDINRLAMRVLWNHLHDVPITPEDMALVAEIAGITPPGPTEQLGIDALDPK